MGEKRSDIPVLKPGVDIASPEKPQPEIDAAVQKLYADSLPKTVQITTDRGLGSGFFMDKDGTVGTAAHVVLGTREQFATTSDGSKYKLQIEKLDDINDTAILRPIGFASGSRPFAEMGSSKNLLPEQPIYPIGHPGGLRPAYISPGNFLNALTLKQLFTNQDLKADAAVEAGLKGLTPKEIGDVQAALARDLIGGKVHIRPGDSGGPMFDASGKVIGVNDMITSFTNGYFVPVEKIRDLYNSNESKFQFTYNRVADPWAQEFKNTWAQKPLVGAAESLTAAGLGYVGYRVMSSFPRSIGMGVTAIEGFRLMDDAGSLLSSTDSRDKLKYSIASAADITGAVSGLAMLSSRFRVGGAIGLAVGVGARLAADFIPTHLVLTDIQRKDNSLLPPMNQDVQKALGF